MVCESHFTEQLLNVIVCITNTNMWLIFCFRLHNHMCDSFLNSTGYPTEMDTPTPRMAAWPLFLQSTY